jgi:hypothetical protein
MQTSCRKLEMWTRRVLVKVMGRVTKVRLKGRELIFLYS